MTRAQFRVRTGVTLVLAHFGVLAATILCYFRRGFLFDEFTTTVAIMVPLFATYTTLVIKDFARDLAGVRRERKLEVPVSLVFITFLLIGLLTTYLLAIVLLKAANLAFEDFEQFKGALALGEIMFGVYIGYIVHALYGPETPANTNRRPGNSEPE